MTYSISMKCINHYLAKYDLFFDHRVGKDKYGYNGHIKIYHITQYESDTNDQKKIKIGQLTYSLDEEIKEINIIIVYIKKDRDFGSVKLLKVLLLYLIRLYEEEADTIFLTAQPSKDLSRVGTEFCLPCYYQKLGFVPVDKKDINKVEKCKKYLSKIDKNFKNDNEYCILCECQVPISKYINVNDDLSRFYVDMRTIMKTMKENLSGIYEEICI